MGALMPHNPCFSVPILTQTIFCKSVMDWYIYICTVNVTWFCKRLLFEKCVSILFLFLCKILNDCNLQKQKQNKLYIVHNILITDWEGRAHQNCCEVHVAKAYWQSSTVIPKCLKDFFCGQSSGHIACTKSGRFYQKGNFGKYEPGRTLLSVSAESNEEGLSHFLVYHYPLVEGKIFSINSKWKGDCIYLCQECRHRSDEWLWHIFDELLTNNPEFYINILEKEQNIYSESQHVG